MREPLVLRALEPDQEEVLRELANVGLGRAMSVLGDTLGTHLQARVPRAHFVSFSDASTPPTSRDEPPAFTATVEHFGSLNADAGLSLSQSTVEHLLSIYKDTFPESQDAEALRESIAFDASSTMLESLLDAYRPLLSARGSYSSTRLRDDAHSWWRAIGRSAVGGIHVELTIDDGDREFDSDFYLLVGPRALDTLLRSAELMIGGTE